MNVNEPAYTTGEAAERYRVTAETVQRWIRTGRLTALDLGGAGSGPFAIRQSDLAEFERNAAAAASADEWNGG